MHVFQLKKIIFIQGYIFVELANTIGLTRLLQHGLSKWSDFILPRILYFLYKLINYFILFKKQQQRYSLLLIDIGECVADIFMDTIRREMDTIRREMDTIRGEMGGYAIRDSLLLKYEMLCQCFK